MRQKIHRFYFHIICKFLLLIFQRGNKPPFKTLPVPKITTPLPQQESRCSHPSPKSAGENTSSTLVVSCSVALFISVIFMLYRHALLNSAFFVLFSNFQYTQHCDRSIVTFFFKSCALDNVCYCSLLY